MTIRLMIVEDQPAIRKGLHMRLAAETDLSIIGEAPDGVAAINLIQSLNPDVVLLDVEMPHLDGIRTAKALHAFCPKAAIIMLSIHDDALTRELSAQAGAAAFIPKTLPTDALLETIRKFGGPRGGK